MAITRTAWIDDDGTGTTGTVINNAEKTLLYDQIDAALVGYLPVNPSGYLTRDLLWSPDNTYDIGKTTANRPRDIFASRSLKVGTGAYLTSIGDMGQVFNGAAANGFLSDDTRSAAGSSQAILFGRNGLGVGSIVTTLTATAYNTTSDARLKRDRGLAGPAALAVLRDTQVHEFDWTMDGTADRGVFAQEAHQVKPTAITVGTDDRRADGTLAQPWQTDYSKYVPDLIVGWQDLDRRLAQLETLLTERTAA